MMLLAAFNVLLIIMRMYCATMTVFLNFQDVKNKLKKTLIVDNNWPIFKSTNFFAVQILPVVNTIF